MIASQEESDFERIKHSNFTMESAVYRINLSLSSLRFSSPSKVDAERSK